ncbi:MAG TPA: NAD(P)H-dependent glycerol-3-phosphate dehydrogenase [bacterium]|nr:NAD(P)H-dependent glycerol-3-phosphate dehydrogenase [bacterium]
MNMRISVVGAGSWGTVLASVLAEKNADVSLWCREPELVEAIDRDHENPLFLPGIPIHPKVKATGDLDAAVTNRDMIVMATPAQHMRAILSSASYRFLHGSQLVIASKGIENGTLKLMHQVAEEIIPESMHRNIFVLSGPTFARELGMKMPTAAVIAGRYIEGLNAAQEFFSLPYFRVYRSPDVVGVEVGGAIKNVIAIGVGIVEGMRLGHNSQSALMTRAIAEITRLAVKIGANPFTISGLSGLGDLILTCTGELSRNRQVGIRIGHGEKLPDILAGMTMVAEGVATSISAYQLAQRMEVAMPIVETVYRVLHEGLDVRTAMSALMGRSLKEEIYGYGD